MASDVQRGPRLRDARSHEPRGDGRRLGEGADGDRRLRPVSGRHRDPHARGRDAPRAARCRRDRRRRPRRPRASSASATRAICGSCACARGRRTATTTSRRGSRASSCDADADVVHLQGYHTAVAPIVMLAALRARIPYVVTLHSGGHSSRLRRKIRPLQAWLLRPLLTRAGRIIAVSAFEADVFARRLRLPRSAFTIIPSGVDLPPGPPEPPDPGPPLILSIGRVESYKGHQRVIEALPGARPRASRARACGSPARVPTRASCASSPSASASPTCSRSRRCPTTAATRWRRCCDGRGSSRSSASTSRRAWRSRRRWRSGGRSSSATAACSTSFATTPTCAASAPNADARRDRRDHPRAARRAAASPPALPTWDRCAATLLQTYEETLAERR